MRSCWTHAQSPCWRIAPRRLSAIANSIHSQLPSIYHTRAQHIVVPTDPLNSNYLGALNIVLIQVFIECILLRDQTNLTIVNMGPYVSKDGKVKGIVVHVLN
jgi:hypothetical protein